MEKYGEAIQQYATTTESMKAIARRFGVNACSLKFIQSKFPELIKKHEELIQQQVKKEG